MAARPDDRLPDEWRDTPRDPPTPDGAVPPVRTSEHEGVVSHRLTKSAPAAGDDGALRPTRAWVSAPRSAWRSPEPEPAERE